MSTEANKALARRVFDEVLNGRNLDLLDEIAASDYVEHSPLPGQGIGIDGIRDRYTFLFNAFDFHFTIDDVIAEGDRVVVRATNHCEQDSFFGVPGRGIVQVFTATFTMQIVDGLIAKVWRNAADLQRLFQLGARILPPTPPGAGT